MYIHDAFIQSDFKFILWNLHTILFKSLGSERFFNVIERSLLCSPGLHLFDQKTVKCNLLLLSSVSHDASEIILI